MAKKFAPLGIGHFPIQIHWSALCVESLRSFFGLRRRIEYWAFRKVISMTLTSFWGILRRSTWSIVQRKHKKLVDPKQTVCTYSLVQHYCSVLFSWQHHKLLVWSNTPLMKQPYLSLVSVFADKCYRFSCTTSIRIMYGHNTYMRRQHYVSNKFINRIGAYGVYLRHN